MSFNSKPREEEKLIALKGATASVRGSANCASFASGKFALRALSQSLAREFGPQGVHVSHVIVDGVIDIPRTKAWKFEHPDAKLSPDAVSNLLPLMHATSKVLISLPRLPIHTGFCTPSREQRSHSN